MKKTIAIILIFGLFIFLLSCGSPTNQDQEPPVYEGTGVIGDIGGTVQVTDPTSNLNGCVVNIPENAVDGEIEVSINEVTEVDSLQTSMIDTTAVIVDFQPSGYQFNEPVEIGIPYTDNVDLETIQIYTFDEEDEMWVAMPIDYIDTDNKIVYTQTDHFSWYVCGDYKSHYDVELYRIGSNQLVLKVQTENLENILSNIQNGYLNMLQILEFYEINNFFVWFKIQVKEDTWLFPDIYQNDWHFFSGNAGFTYMFDPKICRKDEGVVWQNGQATYAYDSQIAKEFFRGDAYVFISDPLPKTYNIRISVDHIFSNTSDPNNANNMFCRYSDNYGFSIKDIDLNDLQELPDTIDYNQNGITNQFDPEPPPDNITVTSPNGGETWQMGTSYNIAWNDNIASNVKIELYKSGSYYRIISSSTSSDGTYSWSIPTDLTESSSYKVKITSTSDSSVNDQSNNYFTIEEEPQADYITVTQPNGGETWQMGTTYNITWSDNISSNVKIDLYKSGTYNREIKDSTPSNGTYIWSIPTDLTESSDYKIRITSTSNSSVNDQSNNYFTIEEEPQVNEPPDQPSNPSPSDNAPCVSTSTNLSWTCSDPDGDPLTYDVYFGTSSSPPLVNSGQSSTTYDPGTLNEETTYYWKIKAHDDHSNSTTGDVWQFTTTSGVTGTVTDIDGNVYQTIIIGNQEWMMENLKVTRYRNGDLIPNVTDNDEWENTSNGAYCIYDNDPSNADTYGNLYNWYAVDDTRGLAPACWHVPTDDDWKELEMFLGMTQAQADSIECRGTNEGSKLAGGDLWGDGDLVNNAEFGTSGFTALPGGCRLWDGYFWDIGYGAAFWSSSEDYIYNAPWCRGLGDWASEVCRYCYPEICGFSVRCVRTVE